MSHNVGHMKPCSVRYHSFVQGSRRDQEILEEGGGAGLSKLDVFCFELSKLFVNSGATDIVLVLSLIHI